jgi:uncharacterized protein involved in exopolysaccharide biosynthesis
MADAMNVNNLSRGLPSKRDIVNLVFKRKKPIIYTFLVTFISVFAGSYVIPLQFSAFSTVYVKRNLPPIPNLTAYHMVLDRLEVINSEVELIKSRAVVEKVVEILSTMGEDPKKGADTKGSILVTIKSVLKPIKNAIDEFLLAIGLIDRPSEREGMISSLRDTLVVKPVVNANIVTISYNSANPKFAATVVNTVTKVYLEASHGLEKRQGVLELYNAQLEESQSAIKKLEEEVQSLKQSASIVSVDEQIKLKLQELTALNTSLNQLRGEKTEITRKIATLKDQIREQPSEVLNAKATRPNPRIDQLRTKLLELEAERARQLEKFVAGSRKVKEFDDAIARIREGLGKEPLTIVDSQTVGMNTIRQNLAASLYQSEADLNAKMARELVLIRQIEEANAELRRLDRHAVKLKEISGAISNAEKSYGRYIDQREEARVAALSDPKMTNVRVVHYASIPEIPVISRMLLIQIGGLLGLLMGLGLAFVLEFFDHSLGNKEDVEYYLELPLLASIPEMNLAGGRKGAILSETKVT